MVHLSIFLIDAVNSLVKHPSITLQIRGEKTQRQQDCVDFRTKWIVLPYQYHFLKKQNTLREKLNHFPIIKNTIKGIAYKNAFESSKNFHSFLYAIIPAESPSYAPIFFEFHLAKLHVKNPAL